MPTFREDTKIGCMVPMMKTDDINDQAITKDKIRDGNVTAEKLADGAVSTDKLPDGAIKTPKIADGNITTSKLAEASVVTSKIADQNVTKEKIADQSVDNSKLSPEAVTYDKLKDKSVITEKLNDRAVTTEKVEEKAITNAKLDDQSVDSRVVREASIESKHIGNNAVSTPKIASRSVTNEKIAYNSVSRAELTPDVRNSIDKKADAEQVNNSLYDLEKKIGERFVVEGDITNLPDEEDLTSVKESERDVIKLADRSYAPEKFSGKGYKILRRNIKPVSIAVTKIRVESAPSSNGTLSFTINGKETQVVVSATTDNTTALVAQKVASALQESKTEYDVSIDASLITLTRKSNGSVTPSVFSASTTGVVCTVTDITKRELRNILTPAMINQPNTIYEIRYDFDLNGETIEIQEGCTLKFEGGSLNNGLTYFNKTNFLGNIKCYTKIYGTLAEGIGKLNVSWFNPYINVLNRDCSDIINNIIDFVNNQVNGNNEITPITIYFPHGRYYLEKEITINKQKNDKRKLYLIGEPGFQTELIAYKNKRRYLIGKYGGNSADFDELSIVMRDLYLSSNNLCDYTAYLPLTSMSYFENCSFVSANLANMYMSYSFSNTFVNCEFRGFDVYHPCGYNFYGGPQWVNALTFIGCRFEGTAYIGIYLNCGFNIKILGCTIEGHNGAGIYVLNADGLSIDGCYFEDNGISKANRVDKDFQGIHFKSLVFNGVRYNNYNFECHADIVLNDLALPFNNYSPNANNIDYDGTIYDDSIKNLFNNIYAVSKKINNTNSDDVSFNVEKSRRPIFITNNSSQRISSKDYINDSFVFSCHSEGLVLIGNTITSIGLNNNNMGYVYSDYISEILLLATFEISIPHKGITMIGNLSSNKTKDDFKLLNLSNRSYVYCTFKNDTLFNNKSNYSGNGIIYLYNIKELNNNDVTIKDYGFSINKKDNSKLDLRFIINLPFDIGNNELYCCSFKMKSNINYNIDIKTLINNKISCVIKDESDINIYILDKSISNIVTVNITSEQLDEAVIDISSIRIFTKKKQCISKVLYDLVDRNNIKNNIILEDNKNVNIHIGNINSRSATFKYNSSNKTLTSLLVKSEINSGLVGLLEYDPNFKKIVVYDNGYKDALGNPYDSIHVGNSSQRPTDVKFGFIYKDTTLNKFIIWDGNSWVNMDGTALVALTSNEQGAENPS